jgi:nucleotide-binding universal stress UspA family protein
VQGLVKTGDPASVILDTALEKEIDLIVMTTHGRSGFSRWMLGSITTKVLREACCPVLAVRWSTPVSRVLIPLDGSDLAEQALEPGFEVARRLGAEVTLLTVHEGTGLDPATIKQLEQAEEGLGGLEQQLIFQGDERYLEAIADHYAADTGVQTHVSVAEGAPAQGILHFSEHWRADLIVMATHGRTGLRRWVYGSVTEKILQSASCALMIIRPSAHHLN